MTPKLETAMFQAGYAAPELATRAHKLAELLQPTELITASKLALIWLETDAITYDDSMSKWERHAKAVQDLKAALENI